MQTMDEGGAGAPVAGDATTQAHVPAMSLDERAEEMVSVPYWVLMQLTSAADVLVEVSGNATVEPVSAEDLDALMADCGLIDDIIDEDGVATEGVAASLIQAIEIGHAALGLDELPPV